MGISLCIRLPPLSLPPNCVPPSNTFMCTYHMPIWATCPFAATESECTAAPLLPAQRSVSLLMTAYTERLNARSGAGGRESKRAWLVSLPFLSLANLDLILSVRAICSSVRLSVSIALLTAAAAAAAAAAQA